MTLPDFLCIGAMRSGTTWLDGILRSHPHIYLPERRKEIHFFDQYYQRGLDWYEDFFPASAEANQYQRIGEITPAYLYFPEVAARIQAHLPNCRFIAVLRNPVDRAYSHYGFHVKNRAETKAFAELIADDSEIFLKGLYGRQIEQYFQYFPPENFLLMIYEQVIAAPDQALRQLGSFLSVEPSQFDPASLSQRANSSGYVRFPKVRAAACGIRDFLRDRDLDWLWNLGRASGLKSLLETKLDRQDRSLAPISAELRLALSERYAADIAALEKLIDTDLSIWRC
ncbi:MAG: sulfotransferase domain-containing protein [Leptolyngbya sp. SIO4C1]|nr:sulfotransferase domain-containing protein [Leptolyngbya sp. SIO4C1]